MFTPAQPQSKYASDLSLRVARQTVRTSDDCGHLVQPRDVRGMRGLVRVLTSRSVLGNCEHLCPGRCQYCRCVTVRQDDAKSAPLLPNPGYQLPETKRLGNDVSILAWAVLRQLTVVITSASAIMECNKREQMLLTLGHPGHLAMVNQGEALL